MIPILPELGILSDVLFLALLGWCSATDLRKRKIPNQAILPLLALGVMHAVIAACLGSPWYEYPLGTLFGVPFFVAWTRGLIGGGDVKLLFVMGLYLGVARMLVALIVMLAVCAGLLLERIFRRRSIHIRLPLAPVLSLGALAAVLLNYLL